MGYIRISTKASTHGSEYESLKSANDEVSSHLDYALSVLGGHNKGNEDMKGIAKLGAARPAKKTHKESRKK